MKSNFSATQWKAIAYFLDKFDYIAKMSVYPNFSFEQPDGTIETKHISQIESIYINREKEER